MKELSFERMENLYGGNAKLDAAGIVVSFVGGTMLLAATAAVTIVSSGTLGWLF